MSTGMGPDSFDSFDFEGMDPDAPGSFGGGGGLPDGGYRFKVVEVIVRNERGSTQIECEVLEAKDTDLVGRQHKEYLAWPDAEHEADYNRIKKEQLLAWCYAAKTTSPEEIKARQQARQGFDSRWLEAMVGRQVLAFVKMGKSYTSKRTGGEVAGRPEISGRVWALDNPKGKGIPGWIDTGKAATAPATTNAAAPAAPVTAPAPQQAPAVDAFADLV